MKSHSDRFRLIRRRYNTFLYMDCSVSWTVEAVWGRTLLCNTVTPLKSTGMLCLDNGMKVSEGFTVALYFCYGVRGFEYD
jgi:hypothetical protein